LLDGLAPQHLFSITAIANSALSLAVQLNHDVYKQYELEEDNKALKKLNEELKDNI